MPIYLNCDRPETPFGNIKCKSCGAEYKFEFDSIKAPYKETGTLTCICGKDLVKWNSTTEPYLVRINNDQK